jgi:hypothetical protein
MILLLFIASASAADSNDADVISIDDTTNTVDEKLALDSSLDDAVSNDNKVLENEENGLLLDCNDGSLATGDD